MKCGNKGKAKGVKEEQDQVDIEDLQKVMGKVKEDGHGKNEEEYALKGSE